MLGGWKEVLKHSVTYQAILEEGEAEGRARGKLEEARNILLLQGRKLLGEPSPEAAAALAALADVRQLEELIVRSVRISSWQELLGLTGPVRRGRGRKKKS
jgi:predicted transposase YdaD